MKFFLTVSFLFFIAVGCAHRSPFATAPHAWLEISAGAFQHNIQQMRQLVGPKVKICAVMKADAYGHGLNLLMPIIIEEKLPCVGITSNAEAKTARESGFHGSIMRLRTATLEEIEEAIEWNVEELIGNAELAMQIDQWIKKEDHDPLNYHLALNSAGMSRNGVDFKSDRGQKDALNILALKNLHIVGVMTHFPVEEKKDVEQGLKQFLKDLDLLVRVGKVDRQKIVAHAANSFATLEVPEARLDMVRVGGALYGDTLATHSEYQHVMTFKSKVAAVNFYPKGNTVNYDRTFTLQRHSTLANIPVGYSDGVRRVFSNKARVLIRGKSFPIVGRVTMNTIMVDVTDDSSVAIGDEVVLFGKQGKEEITQSELEKSAETIFADLYTIWGNSNQKVLIP